MCMLKCILFVHRRAFLALSAARNTEGPRLHYGASLGPGRAQWFVLWAFQMARADLYSWLLRSAVPSRARPRKPHHFIFSVCWCWWRCYISLPPSLKLSTLGNHGTTPVAHQALPFATATGGSFVREGVCHVSCRRRNWGRTQKKKGDINDGFHALFLRNFEGNRAATVHNTTASGIQPHHPC